MSPTCKAPIAWDDLVAYWAGDLAPEALDRLDEHLMGCGACTAASARVSTITETVRALIPPIVDHARIAALRARGLRIVDNRLLPNERRTVRYELDTDILLHRLGGLDLSGAERVSLKITSEGTGAVLLEEPSAPFDRESGEVLIACQRHFASFPPDILVEVRTYAVSGAETVARYPIPHVFASVES
jgi:Putative zinc-finger